MSRLPNSRDARFRRAQAAQQAADKAQDEAGAAQQAALDSLSQRVTTIESAPPSFPDITGPAILGRESGTGQPVAITLGTGFSIVGGVLTYTPPVTP